MSITKTPRQAATKTKDAVVAPAALAAPKPTPTPTKGRASKPATAAPAAKKAASGTKAKPLPAAKLPELPAAPASAAAANHKLVRDSFTMPEADFALIAVLKEKAVELKRPAKKSELLRAGLQLLAQQTPAKLKAALDALAPIKTGRPKKG